MTTYGVVIPSFMTAFAIFASFELAARKAGKKGFLQIVRWLPWGNPTFSGCALGMILFLVGGFGGIVNSSYSMDILVHNTMWIVGHFHVTVGGPAALSFIGAAYTLVPADLVQSATELSMNCTYGDNTRWGNLALFVFPRARAAARATSPRICWSSCR